MLGADAVALVFCRDMLARAARIELAAAGVVALGCMTNDDWRSLGGDPSGVVDSTKGEVRIRRWTAR
jgi:hypothetical protein